MVIEISWTGIVEDRRCSHLERDFLASEVGATDNWTKGGRGSSKDGGGPERDRASERR